MLLNKDVKFNFTNMHNNKINQTKIKLLLMQSQMSGVSNLFLCSTWTHQHHQVFKMAILNYMNKTYHFVVAVV